MHTIKHDILVQTMKHAGNIRNGFTLIELLVVIAILAILVVSGIASFTSSQKKSRDIRRKNDLRQISLALESYYNDFGSFPKADGSGNIMGCGAGGVALCEWGKVWSNTTPSPATIYMLTLPKDVPASNSYYYTTDANGSYYRLYARIENDQDEGPGVKQAPGYVGPTCGGTQACTYGISSTNTTLE